MVINGNVRISLAALTALAAAAIVFAGPASAYQCKSQPIQAAGEHKLKVAAHNNARKNWQATVKNQLGLSWSLWSIAQGKSVNCNKSHDRWVCNAKARPCNYVVP